MPHSVDAGHKDRSPDGCITVTCTQTWVALAL